MDLLFSGVTIVTMDEAMHVYFDAYLGVTGTKISYISKDPPTQAPQKIMDATGMVLMPGLINCHTHLALSLLRGYAGGSATVSCPGRTGWIRERPGPVSCCRWPNAFGLESPLCRICILFRR